jgi:small GTP-binding protein
MSRRKIVLLGEIGVGKTSVIRRFVLDRFETTYKGTLGYNIYTSAIIGVGPNNNETLELLIWDTDGSHGDRLLAQKPVVQGTSAVLIVADLTRPRTLATMAHLARAVETGLPGRHIHLILNKSDLLEDVATVSKAPTLPAELDGLIHPSIRTSAKSGDNIQHAFRETANAILRRGL